MAEVQIEDVLVLLGEKLSDGVGGPPQRLRDFLNRPQWTPGDFHRWVDECVTKGGRSSENRQFYNVLQDLIVGVGHRLGFDVEYGRYAGSTSEIAFDGLWRSSNGDIILIEVKTSVWPIESVAQLGQYLERYASDHQLNPKQVFGLYAIGGGDLQPVVSQIRGSDYRNVLRVISFDDLLRLWQLAEDLGSLEDPHSGRDRVQAVLLPVESINIGSFIHIIQSIAELAKAQQEVTDVPVTTDPAVSTAELPWDDNSLTKYLTNATPYQIALLGSLALSDAEPLPMNQLIAVMKRLQPKVKGIGSGDMTGLSVAGARAGLKMRREGFEDLIDDATGEYRLKTRYKETVLKWAMEKWELSKELLVPTVPELAEEEPGLQDLDSQ